MSSNKIINILASSSPRRKDILSQIGFSFKTIPSQINENFNLELPPEAFCEHWAREKAKVIANSNSDSFIIGADTIIFSEGRVLGKPRNKKQSIFMLESISGKTHEVLTGVSIINLKYEIDITFNQTSRVTCNTLSKEDILNYIEDYRPFNKAGSYGIQDGFCKYINNIEGCFYNILGFPISKFHRKYHMVTKEIIID